MLKSLLFVTFLCLSLGQLGALSKSEGLNLYAYDLAVFVFAAIGTLVLLLKKQFILPKPALIFMTFLLFGALTLIPNAFVLSSTGFLTSAFYLVRLGFYICAGVVVYNMLTTKKLTERDLHNFLLFSGVLLIFGGLLQLIFLPDISVLDSALGWDPHKNRMVSTLLDPNFLGGYIVICLTILLNRLLAKKEKPLLLDKVLFITFLLSLILTFSRSSWLMFAVVIFIFGIVKSRMLLFMCILIAFSAYFAVPRIQTRLSGITDPADSASFRLVSWSNAWTIFVDHPLLGIGFNTYRYVQGSYGFIDTNNTNLNSGAGADSSLLLVLATTGIFGMALFVGGFVSCFKETPTIFVLALLAGLLIHSLFVNSLFYPQILFAWVAICIGCSGSKGSFSRKRL